MKRGDLRRLWLPLLGILAVLVPFLFWRGTWFGRPLNDAEIGRYLSDLSHPRHVQHALSQVADRIIAGNRAGVERWYPQVRDLAHNETREVRMTAAWVLGQDPQHSEAPAVLATLLADPEPLVRRNAALALVRFGDDRGHDEITTMLRPYTVRSPATGRARLRLEVGSTVNPGTLLARIEPEGGESIEVRSPVSGRVGELLLPNGSPSAEGDPLMKIEPSQEEIWEGLRALYLIGRPEDLEALRFFARGGFGASDQVKRQATLTAEAIERRQEGR